MTDHTEEFNEEEYIEEGVLLLERIRTDKPLIDLIIASQAFQLDHDLDEDSAESDVELVEKLMDEIMDVGQILENAPEGVEITQEMNLSTRIKELEERGLAVFGLLDEQDHILDEEDDNALPVTLKVAVIGVYPADDEHIVHFEGKELMPIMVDDWDGEEDYDPDCEDHEHGCGCGCGCGDDE